MSEQVCCGPDFRPGDHPSPGPHHVFLPRRDDGDREGGIESDLRIDARNDRKGDGFGNERKGHDETGEHIAANIAEPLLAVGIEGKTGETQQGDFRNKRNTLGILSIPWPGRGGDRVVGCPAGRRPEEPPG